MKIGSLLPISTAYNISPRRELNLGHQPACPTRYLDTNNVIHDWYVVIKEVASGLFASLTRCRHPASLTSSLLNLRYF